MSFYGTIFSRDLKQETQNTFHFENQINKNLKMLDLNKKNHSKQNMIKHSEIQNGRLSVSNNKTINNKHIKQNNEKGLSTNERRIWQLKLFSQ